MKQARAGHTKCTISAKDGITLHKEKSFFTALEFIKQTEKGRTIHAEYRIWGTEEAISVHEKIFPNPREFSFFCHSHNGFEG